MNGRAQNKVQSSNNNNTHHEVFGLFHHKKTGLLPIFT